MSGFVPALAGHVELQLVRDLFGREVVGGAASTFKRLDLANKDSVHTTTSAIGNVFSVGVYIADDHGVSKVR